MNLKGIVVALLFFSVVVGMAYVRYGEDYGYPPVIFPEDYYELENLVRNPEIANALYAIFIVSGLISYYIISYKPTKVESPHSWDRPSQRKAPSSPRSGPRAKHRSPKRLVSNPWRDQSPSRMKTRIVDGVTTYYRDRSLSITEIRSVSKAKTEEKYQCDLCEKDTGYLYRCSKCKGKFCESHRYPEDHNCGKPIEKVDSKIKNGLDLLFK